MNIAHHLVFGMKTNIDSNPFIIRVKTDNAGTSAANQFTLPLQDVTGLTYDYFVDWGDGEFTSHNTNTDVTHTFPSVGTYDIRIYGKFEKILFNNNGDRLKLLEVMQWGDSYGKFANQNNAFHGCSNLTSIADDLDVSSVTNMHAMFSGCTSFNSDLSTWNVSNVTNMSNMFNGCTSFNSDLSTWNVGNVTNIFAMFSGCTSFNSDLSTWNVSNVTNMSNMFNGCTSFNSDLSTWNVGNVLSFDLFMWYGNVPATKVIDFSQWTFNKNVNFGLFIQFMSGTRVFNIPEFDVFLQKLATSVIRTGRTETRKICTIAYTRYSNVGKPYYDALVADGWTFPHTTYSP